MSTAFASVWAGVLLLSAITVILLGHITWQVRGLGSIPSEVYRTLVGLYVLTAFWDLYRGRIVWAVMWLVLAGVYYTLLRKQDPPEGKSLGDCLRLPRWLRS